MASKQVEIIKVPDDDDFPNSGPQNPVEAQSYRDRIDAIMDAFSDILVDNHKDALRLTITSLKKLMVKHWQQMAEVDVEGSDEVHPQPPVASTCASISPQRALT